MVVVTKMKNPRTWISQKDNLKRHVLKRQMFIWCVGYILYGELRLEGMIVTICYV